MDKKQSSSACSTAATITFFSSISQAEQRRCLHLTMGLGLLEVGVFLPIVKLFTSLPTRIVNSSLSPVSSWTKTVNLAQSWLSLNEMTPNCKASTSMRMGLQQSCYGMLQDAASLLSSTLPRSNLQKGLNYRWRSLSILSGQKMGASWL